MKPSLRTKQRATRRRGGLSLLELMIALTVLAIGLLGMLAMQTNALKSSRHGKSVSESSRIAEAEMAFLHRQAWAAVPVAGWSAPRIVTAVTNGTGPSVPQAYSVSFRVQAGPDPALRTLDVAVTWTDPEAPVGSPVSTYNISSVRHNDP